MIIETLHKFWINLKSSRADSLLLFIFVANSLLYVLLLAQDTTSLVGLAALSFLCIFHWLINKNLGFKTHIGLPIIGLIALLPVSVFISVDLGSTLPKIYGLTISIFFFYSIANYIDSLSHLRITILALLLLTFAIPVLGFLATDWSGSSFALPTQILSRLGQHIPFITRLSSGGGIHVNTLGGTISFFIPLLLSLLWDNKAIKRTYLNQNSHRGMGLLAVKLLFLLSLVFSLTVLVFTQSRGSFLGVAVGTIVLVIWKNPRLYWLIPFIIVLIFAAFLVLGDGNFVKFVSLLDNNQESDTLQTRLDYWQRTVFLIQDFPITGVGLGTYGKVFDEIYKFTAFSHEDQPAFYAHNMYLAVAASMGLPALILFFALFSGIATMVITTYKKVRSVAKVLLMGLSCGIIANLIYGIWDNYLLGEKLAIVLWIYLGIITAIYVHQNKFKHRHSRDISATEVTPQQRPIRGIIRLWAKNFLFAIAAWFIFSLASISFININPYISLALASLGGILLGFVLTKRFENILLTTNGAPVTLAATP